MAFLLNRVKTTSSTGGTGTLTTGAPPLRWRGLDALPIGATRVPLLIEDLDSADWEISYCTILSANTFSRDQLIDSSTGFKVDFAATPKTVTLVMNAADLASFVSGVTITGSTALGGVLTAVLPPGSSASSFQWSRQGADIDGATGATYTVGPEDQAPDGQPQKKITVRPIGFAPGSTGVTVPNAPPGIKSNRAVGAFAVGSQAA